MADECSKCSYFDFFSKKRHVFQSKTGLVFDSKTCLFSLTKSCIPSYFWLWVSFFETQSGFKVVSNSIFLKPKVVFFFSDSLGWYFFFCSLVSRSEKSCFLAKIHHKLGFNRNHLYFLLFFVSYHVKLDGIGFRFFWVKNETDWCFHDFMGHKIMKPPGSLGKKKWNWP